MKEYIEDKLKDECGVFGIYSITNFNVCYTVYYGLYALQHRGEESAGIAVFNNKILNYHKQMGLVGQIFNDRILSSMSGNKAIGHVRYSTCGLSEISNAQPILGKFKNKDLVMAHNGNLINTKHIKEYLIGNKNINFNTTTDSEVVLKLIELNKDKTIEECIISVMNKIEGSYAMIFLMENKLIGIRDKLGIRPLCIGKLDEDYILASESCALQSIGAEFIRNVKPGEIIIIDNKGIRAINSDKKLKCYTCMFEYIYFGRADSVIDDVNVCDIRVSLGEKLFEQALIKADIVIGVPDSGIYAAEGYAKASKIPFKIGIVKNKYIGRTFINPSKEFREKDILMKLNILETVVKGKNIVVVDDSIVRGTTIKRLIKLLKKVGVKEIHFRVACLVIKYPCYFGIATPSKEDLIGAYKSIEEIRKFIGVDSLEYLSEENLVEVFKDKKKEFCLGCFKGKYPNLKND